MLGAMFIINHHATGSVVIQSLFQKKQEKKDRVQGHAL
jgi:hypothetical protein